ncbi:ABC transporter permease [Flavihumibacter stibioxidans]|uniref:Transport permease protein n=1 Tax=Flavihumibacter stibioxidans TaxID=1834163 RepID=A0ABR7MBL4_9BACT|nr:ABC transporter permease [Flavihumibacter stibioxidans]MBC6492347.1 multidrug ABC transporter permease [Flavihumibacter stibioxidans]
MKQFLVFVRKEFLHAFRDRKTLLIMFGLPIVQIILFGFALTNEVKNSKLVIVDPSRDEASQALTNRIRSSKYFDIYREAMSYAEMEAAFRSGKIKAAIVFPQDFNEQWKHLNNVQLQLITDGSDPNTGRTIQNYLTAIINDFRNDRVNNGNAQVLIHPNIRMLYNPSLEGTMNFVPGVMALVLLLVCTTLTAVSIVRERELGTMEILLVSPFKPVYVLLSKAVPYFILSMVNLSVILLLGTYVLNVPVKGSVSLLLLASALFILTCLSMGLLISTLAKTQQTAMIISMMGMMLPTVLLTGFMFPIENMPVPLQVISNIVPSRWYYLITKDVMLKGLGFSAIWKELLVLGGMTVFLLLFSLKKFNNRLS